jgi:hypothetical protein
VQASVPVVDLIVTARALSKLVVVATNTIASINVETERAKARKFFLRIAAAMNERSVREIFFST